MVTVIKIGRRKKKDKVYMNERQLAYFRDKLLAWREDLLASSHETVSTMRSVGTRHPDPTDQAVQEAETALKLHTGARYRELISKIENALDRIDDGTYGFCEETGEPIGLKRLESYPVATLSLEAQERHEREEKLLRQYL